MHRPTVPIEGSHVYGDATHVLAEGLRPATAEEIVGPYFPVRPIVSTTNDLTVIAGRELRALGQVVYISGRVTDRRGTPVQNAELEIWQANAAGRYPHPADENTAPIDQNFDGHTKIRTDLEGNWRLKTIKPGGYPVTPDWCRPPHIHFDVRGRASRLVTQMYFEGEPLNEMDILLQRSWGGKETAIAHYVGSTGLPEPNALVAVWNIVLLAG
ncbi:MAG: protocatechuate 3,4-dioxygenase [Hyphomicrobiaceae bacterium]|nr:protocatechuate 3,4-dioxygenase [Hyphomicrobiaceae bacterium]